MNGNGKLRKRMLAALLVCAAGAWPARGAEWHVDQRHAGASDANAGGAEAPFKTLAKGVASARAGDTIRVKPGMYREELVFKASGAPGKRIVLKAEAGPGERVILSGSEELKGWRPSTREEARGNPHFERIYVAETDVKPFGIFVDGVAAKLARMPRNEKSWFAAESSAGTSIRDAQHLTQPAGFYEGGTIVVRHPSTNRFRDTIVRYDAEARELHFASKMTESVSGKDQYCVQNLPNLIEGPGQFAWEARGERFRIFLWPPEGGALEKRLVEQPVRGASGFLASWDPGVGHLTLDGLEIQHGVSGAIGGSGGKDLEIVNCILHHNLGGGSRHAIALNRQEGALIRHNIVMHNNHSGIGLSYGRELRIEENWIFKNRVDGMAMGWETRKVTVARNLIQDQWDGGHPDGFQTFRQVSELTLDSNLIFNTGQMWQCGSTSNSRMVNNMFVGSHDNGLSITSRIIFDKYGNEGQTWAFNTLAFFKLGGMSLVKDFKVHDSVIAPGTRMALMSSFLKYEWTSDRNLYWAPGAKEATFHWKGESLNFEKYREASGQDRHSKYGAPCFRRAPAHYSGGTDGAHERGKLFLSNMSPSEWEAGDHVEVNWDGIARKIKASGEGWIEFEPALAEAPDGPRFVAANWKKETNFELDLRVTDESPAKGLGEGGKDAGSSVDIQAYLRLDFDGDGKRDVPELPKALEHLKPR
ncbi:MAG: right-handed parallel beta-helix repeat-containing protein [Planctomycetota bacterium]|nr:right-handed parallel beta-helix repeat-containing protein [Planctomycetota bacterium]